MEDLRKLALELLETEKRFLLQDKDDHQAAVAVVVTPEGRYWEEVEFNDEDEKIAAYAGVVQRAKEQNATAIITVNTSRQQIFPANADMDGYYWGRLQSESSPRALTLTISGAGMHSWCLSLPFQVANGEVIFGQATEFQSADVALLPNWP